MRVGEALGLGLRPNSKGKNGRKMGKNGENGEKNGKKGKKKGKMCCSHNMGFLEPATSVSGVFFLRGLLLNY